MRKINFTKMAGAGNDFVVIDNGLRTMDCAPCAKNSEWNKIAAALCERKTGIGADGMLILEKSKKADFRMRIFNADGSEAEMCGNGLRCAVLFAGMNKKVKVEAMAGIYEGEITAKDKVRIKMEDPRGLRLDFPINVSGRTIRANFINTGVPHAVIFVEGLDKINVDSIGREVRHHNEFKPKGSNVNFIEIIDKGNIKIRTYERGVEGETLACGTGSVASAIISAIKVSGAGLKVNVRTKGGVLKVEFDNIKNEIKNVYLEGGAKIVFAGKIIL